MLFWRSESATSPGFPGTSELRLEPLFLELDAHFPSPISIVSTPSAKLFQTPGPPPNRSTRSKVFRLPSQEFGIGTPMTLMPRKITTGFSLLYSSSRLAFTRNVLPPRNGKSGSTGIINLALAERNTSLARAKSREAIKLEPREGHFYALRGDAYFMDERYRDASRDYSSAISRQADFFYYYLQRGLASEKARSDSSAKRDLERGIELLPTGPAYLGLGNIAKRSGRLDEAKKLYATASQAPGGTGQAAQAELMRIDFPDNPEKYLGKRVGLDDRGRVLGQIDNPTSVPATDIELVVRYRDGNGGVRQVSRSIDGTLAAGRSSRVALGLGPFSSTDEFRVDISSARIAEASKRR